MRGEVNRIQNTEIAWSNDLPLTADIYPSIPSCGRPLAFQIAEEIRRNKRSKKKFAVTFEKEQVPDDHDHWKPPNDFVSNFRSEFVKQFPGSTVAAEEKAEADLDSKALKPLEIKLSFKPPESIRTGKQIAGTISARWTTSSNTRALALSNFIDKPWVVDPDKYIAENRDERIGFSKRLARDPAEAASLARDSVHANPDQVVDRFVQKISLPYGELWQEAVLVNYQNIEPNLDANYVEYSNLVPLVLDELGHDCRSEYVRSQASRP